MALTVLAGPVIQAGQSLSDPLDCTAGKIIRLMMPAAWTPANLTFQVSSENTTWANLYSAEGAEIMIPVRSGSVIVLAVGNGAPTRELPPELRGTWIKVRSGSAAFPVVQAAQRQFQVTLDA